MHWSWWGVESKQLLTALSGLRVFSILGFRWYYSLIYWSIISCIIYTNRLICILPVGCLRLHPKIDQSTQQGWIWFSCHPVSSTSSSSASSMVPSCCVKSWLLRLTDRASSQKQASALLAGAPPPPESCLSGSNLEVRIEGIPKREDLVMVCGNFQHQWWKSCHVVGWQIFKSGLRNYKPQKPSS